MNGKVTKVSGCMVRAEGLESANVSDVVRVGDKRLIGEILNMTEDCASIQMYEETAGLGLGEEAVSTGYPLYIELGPGMLGGVFDGIARPLYELHRLAGDNITKGMDITTLSREKLWDFVPKAEVGDAVASGDIIGTVRENGSISHKIMVPFGVTGTVASIQAGSYSVTDSVCLVKGDNGENYKLTMTQKWPVRKARPYVKKRVPSKPLISGQRAIDTLFPIAKGGAAVIAGVAGSGKTVLSQAISKWSDADILVYVACGVSGNEIAGIMSELKDERSGETRVNRTVVIANSSDMPIMARDAEIYTGITIAEYFRDMGYDVALVADSVSLWAEALREMSGRLEELPGDEGYPAYLNSRIAQFYERAGLVECLGSDDRAGSLTVIGTVSIPSGKAFEPVLQAAEKAVRTVLYLDPELVSERSLPAISEKKSYSLYADSLKRPFDEELKIDFSKNRDKALSILRKEADIKAKTNTDLECCLVPSDLLKLETAKLLREDFLRQDAFDEADGFTSYERQAYLLQLILDYCALGQAAIDEGTDIARLLSIPALELIGKAKSISENEYRDTYKTICESMARQISEISEGGGDR